MGEKQGDQLHLLNWGTLVSRSLGSRASPKWARVGIVGGEGGRDEWLKVGWMLQHPWFVLAPAELKQKNLPDGQQVKIYTITFHQLKTLPPAVYFPKTS